MRSFPGSGAAAREQPIDQSAGNAGSNMKLTLAQQKGPGLIDIRRPVKAERQDQPQRQSAYLSFHDFSP